MNNQFKNIQLVCICGKPFTWTSGEQTFLNQLHEEGKIQSVTEPKRCPDCRKQRREHFENRSHSTQQE